MTETDPIACSLDGGELEARLAAVRDVGRAALISREVAGNGHRLRFRGEPGIRARLEQIAQAELECCPFLSLTLEEEAGELVLAIEAPSGGEATATGLAAAFDTMAQEVQDESPAR